jgi:glycosyltransferase involved in cell wall biosynthesis
MPRILMVCARYHPLTGGIETHVHETARRLASRGCGVAVLTTDTTGEQPKREQIAGVSIIRVPAWPSWSDIRFAPRVYSEIVRGDWDLVHVQGYHTFVPPIAMAAAKRAGMPFVVTFHSGGHSSRTRNALRGVQRLALRPLFRNAARFVGVSRYEADLFSRGLERLKFSVVPNGGELPTPSPDAMQRSNGRLIVSIGRLERYKGHQRAIEAMPHILRRLPDARLRIAGQGPYEQELRRLVARLRLAECVHISAIPPGDRRAMADLLAEAALVVLFSDYEAHPVAVMEALALRRKIIVSDTSGFVELIEQGHVRGSPLGAKAAERARLIVETMASAWVPPAVALPTWDDCVDRLLSIYRAALVEHGIREAA